MDIFRGNLNSYEKIRISEQFNLFINLSGNSF